MPVDRHALEQVAAAVAPTGATLAHLGTGGFASTFKVTEADGTTWALKVVDAAQADAQRSQRELNALQAVAHPNIVGYRGTGTHEHGGTTYRYLAMEYVEGTTLATALAAGATYSRREAVHLLRQAVDGLIALWAKGNVHRDLSPSNLIITPAGDLVIVDLGMARALDDTTITTLPTPGTPGWMSPEQVGPQPTHGNDWKSDQFVLGLIAYRLVTDTEPFTYTSAYEAWLAPNDQRPRNPRLLDPSIPTALSDLIEKMLAKQPHRRYLRPEALAADLERIAITLDVPDNTLDIEPEFILIIGDKKTFASEPGFLTALAPDRLLVEPRARGRVHEFFTAAGPTTTKLLDPCTYLARSPHAVRPAYYTTHVPGGDAATLTGFATPAAREATCYQLLDFQIAAGADEILAPYFYAGPGEQTWIQESLLCAEITAEAIEARAPLRGGVAEPVCATVAVNQGWLTSQTHRDTLLTLLTATSAPRVQLLVSTSQPSFGPLHDLAVLRGIADVTAVLREAGTAVVLGRRASEGLLGLALGAAAWSTGVSGVQMNMSPHPEKDETGGRGYDRIYVPQLLTHLTTGSYVQLNTANPHRLTLTTPQARALMTSNPALDPLTTQERRLLLQHNIAAARDQVRQLAAVPTSGRIPLMRTWVQQAQAHFRALPTPGATGEGSAFLDAWAQIL